MFNDSNPQTGSLLISEPFMLDPNFERSVLLLCEHNELDGTFGVILNHKSTALISLQHDEIDPISFPLFTGGPVQTEDLFFIHRANDRIPGGKLVYDDIYFGGDFQVLIELIKNEELLPDEIKFFKGYSGWQPNQLESELQENSWAVHNHFKSDLPFFDDGENLWKQALIDLGPKYAHVVNFPKSPNMN
ncbi:YqgE/AlgH family protein [Sphingobacterium hungaricum]